jgi:hypothetical protein
VVAKYQPSQNMVCFSHTLLCLDVGGTVEQVERERERGRVFSIIKKILMK